MPWIRIADWQAVPMHDGRTFRRQGVLRHFFFLVLTRELRPVVHLVRRSDEGRIGAPERSVGKLVEEMAPSLIGWDVTDHEVDQVLDDLLLNGELPDLVKPTWANYTNLLRPVMQRVEVVFAMQLRYRRSHPDDEPWVWRETYD